MKKILLPAVVLFSLTAYGQPNNDDAEMLGTWRIFASDHDVTAVLRSKDDTADMDLYCDKEHLESSVYLKKQPENGELTSFAVSIDNNVINDKGWQANSRTRSTTVKTSSPEFIKALLNKQEIVFSYSLENQPKMDVAFDLTEVNQVIERINQVCQLDLSKYK